MYRRTCLLCGLSSQTAICGYCKRDLTVFDLEQWRGNLLHVPWIADSVTPVYFDSLLAVAPYKEPFQGLIRNMKYNRNVYCLAALSELLCDCLLTRADLPEVIIPVPLHTRRLVERGYNQAAQLALSLSRRVRVPVDTAAIFRHRYTAPQSGLDKSDRRDNIRDAFHLASPVRQYSHIAVLDDVLTTGATINAVCRLLRRAIPGVRIDVWVLCVTPPRR